MSLAELLTEAVTVVHLAQGVADRYGDQGSVETGRDAYPAKVFQTDSTELVVGRDTVVSDWSLFLPAGAVIAAYDRVELADGRVYEVAGAPDRLRTPRGEHHVEARLRYVAG